MSKRFCVGPSEIFGVDRKQFENPLGRVEGFQLRH